MTCKDRLITYLKSQPNTIQFTIRQHQDAETSYEIAEYLNLNPSEVAKVVMVWVDNEMIMVVVSAPNMVSFEKLRKYWDTARIKLADEEDFAGRFRDCDLGAMPPFGNLYGFKAYIDCKLAANKTIAFRVGTHTDTMFLYYSDFEHLVKPTVRDLTIDDEEAGH